MLFLHGYYFISEFRANMNNKFMMDIKITLK